MHIGDLYVHMFSSPLKQVQTHKDGGRKIQNEMKEKKKQTQY